MQDSPIFLLGSERSGTNLLRRRLSTSQKSAVGPPPLHFLKHFFYACPFYGDLANNDNFVHFISDTLGLAYNHFSPWDESIDANEVMDRYSEFFPGQRSAIGVMHTIYSIYAHRKGYKTYFCKDNNLFDFVSDILFEIPNARFIYLYRDPRDVVLSQRRRPMQNRSASYLAKLWRDEQIKCIRAWASVAKSEKAIELSYETLITHEEDCLEAIRNQFNMLPADNSLIDYCFENTQMAEWRNINKPTIQNNTKKYAWHFNDKTVAKIEGIAWHQMRWLGYTPENSRRPNVDIHQIKLEAGVGALFRFLRTRLAKSNITEGQRVREAYIRSVSEKWK